MKKDNKAAQRRAAETIGVDLGDKVSHYAILNEEGRIVEEGHFRNNEESIAKHFGKIGKACVALEVGAQSGQGLGAAAMGIVQKRWQRGQETRSDRRGAQASGGVASDVDDWGKF